MPAGKNARLPFRVELIFILIHTRPEADLYLIFTEAAALGTSRNCVRCGLKRRRWIWVLFLRESMQKRKCSGGNPPCAISLQSHNPRRRAGEGRERKSRYISLCRYQNILALILARNIQPSRPLLEIVLAGELLRICRRMLIRAS